jgi:hypothetical protein
MDWGISPLHRREGSYVHKTPVFTMITEAIQECKYVEFTKRCDYIQPFKMHGKRL